MIHHEMKMQDFCERLKQAIKNSGIKQKVLAEKTGLGESELSDLVNGKVQNPKIQTINKLAIELNISIDWLCGFAEYPEVKSVPKEIQKQIITEFLFKFLNISIINKERLIRIPLRGEINEAWQHINNIDFEYKHYGEIEQREYEKLKNNYVMQLKNAIAKFINHSKSIKDVVEEEWFFEIPCDGKIYKAYEDLQQLEYSFNVYDNMSVEEYNKEYQELLDRFSNVAIDSLIIDMSEKRKYLKNSMDKNEINILLASLPDDLPF